ncbi:MAG TPA: HlyD family efflux transporter periplasmic adaptor subunit [Polyangia bacterium]|jgi:HlyD family secretion protein|nr:HlyD family efflux transporter periplasmic adaptor subunit [Polyangia bacterium]
MQRLQRFIPHLLLASLGLVYLGYRFYVGHQPYEWSGTVEARVISVGSRAGGRVKEVRVREGDRVTEGQVLVVLEPGDLEAQRLQAEGQLLQAEANLEKLVKGARPEEIQQAQARAITAQAALQESRAGARHEQIAGADARLRAAQATAEKARTDADRIRKLATSGAATQADLDGVETRLRESTAQRDAAEQTLLELRNGVRQEELRQAQARALEAEANARLVKAGSREEDIKAARGAVEAARGRLQAVETLIDELKIKAPRPSRVEALDLRPGDLLAPSATAATLLEEDQLFVRIYVPETLIGHVKMGQEVPISVDSFPNRQFKGVIEHINAIGEYSPRNLQTADERADQVFATRVGLREGGDVLKAGMAAFIRVPK